MENIGNYIRARRREINMSQVELGEKIGKSSQVISNWERGYTKGVSVEDLKNLARALDADIKYFFPDTGSTSCKCHPIVDKRLQKIIDLYPRLDEHTKDIIDAVIRVGKRRMK